MNELLSRSNNKLEIAKVTHLRMTINSLKYGRRKKKKNENSFKTEIKDSINQSLKTFLPSNSRPSHFGRYP